MRLYDYQLDAIKRLKTGSILNGGVGSGKSITALFYWYKYSGKPLIYKKVYDHQYPPKPLYIITTARKRDTMEWNTELAKFGFGTVAELNPNCISVVIDSWNSIEKYKDAKDAFFIFDEQKVVGYGKWAKTFIKIAKQNDWIMLSATPGDTWMDYASVFIANGFYKNKTEFVREHVIYNNFSRFPQVRGYINCAKLVQLRNQILVNMDYKHEIVYKIRPIKTAYDCDMMKTVVKDYWNPFEDRPIENPSEHYYLARKVSNINKTRTDSLGYVYGMHKKLIVFYTFNYEREAIEQWAIDNDILLFQWNGNIHEDVPDLGSWIYLVQYNAGAEGWNCIKTNAMVFYSLNPSYKQSAQAAGRIDRCNTPFDTLYYYVFTNDSYVDKSIRNALKNKESFNAKDFAIGVKETFHYGNY